MNSGAACCYARAGGSLLMAGKYLMRSFPKESPERLRELEVLEVLLGVPIRVL